MRGPRLAAGTAALMAAACLAGMATVASAAPSKASLATASSRSGIREVPPGKKYSTAKLGAVRQQSARARALAAPAAPTPPVGTVRQWIALDDFNGILYRKDYTLRGVGAHIEVWVANDLAFPAGDCRTQVATSTQITDAQVAHLISEFDSNMYPKETRHLQHASGPGRHQRPPRTRRQRQRRRLHRRRRQDRRADRQRPGRQLLHVPGGADLHRRLLLLAVQRAARSQRHDGRRVRLAAPHHREPAGRAHRRPVHEPPGAPEPLRGHVRPRVAAPAALLHRPVRDDLGQRGPVRLRPDPDGLRRRDGDGVRSRRRQPHLLLPGLRHRPDAVQPQPAGLRRAGELAEPVGRGQPERGAGRLRQRVLVDAVPRSTATARTSSPGCTTTASCRGCPASTPR